MRKAINLSQFGVFPKRKFELSELISPPRETGSYAVLVGCTCEPYSEYTDRGGRNPE